VDDILLFCNGSRRDVDYLHRGITLFKVATGMQINLQKSTMSLIHLRAPNMRYLSTIFLVLATDISQGLKYLGFYLKQSDYHKSNRKWLIGKLEKRLQVWSNKWLSRAGRLTLVKSVLEAIPIYWMSIAWIPKGILEKLRHICFAFLWQGQKEIHTRPWVTWDKISIPKALGVWGLKNIFRFSTVLAAKCGWRLISTTNLWTEVILQKYISPSSLFDWIRNPQKNFRGGSIFWKTIVKSFHLISDRLAWRVKDGCSVRLGMYP
jgi:hypothetical protein